MQLQSRSASYTVPNNQWTGKCWKRFSVNYQNLSCSADIFTETIRGGRQIDRKRETIAIFIEQNYLVFINVGSGRRIGDRGKMSPIDLSFTSVYIARKTKWTLDYSSSIGSDHFPITISIGGRVGTKPLPALQK